jgi:hypothetical protein
MLRLNLAVTPPLVHRPEELVARGTFTNGGTEPLRFSAVAVSAPSLALLLRRVGGAVVPLAPPPVPYAQERSGDYVVLPPGGSHSIVYQGFLPPRLGCGDYEICLRYRAAGIELSSEWETFTCV